MLYEFVDSNKLSLYESQSVISMPSDAYEFLDFVPATRLPQGEQAGVPSLLDYCCATEGIVCDSWVDWAASPSDHAAVVYEFAVTCTARRYLGK